LVICDGLGGGRGTFDWLGGRLEGDFSFLIDNWTSPKDVGVGGGGSKTQLLLPFLGAISCENFPVCFYFGTNCTKVFNFPLGTIKGFFPFSSENLVGLKALPWKN
jgi:hypothetical protein